MESNPDRWVVKPVRLKFAVGEVTLFSVGFSLAVLDAHFTQLEENAFSSAPGWDVLPQHIDGALIRSQPIAEPLPRVALFTDAVRYVPAQYQRYYLDFQQTFAEYQQKFSSLSRSKRKKEIKKFTEHSGGTIDLREYRTRDEVIEFWGYAKELSSKTFQERLLDAGLPQSEKFREQILELAARDRVRAYLLFHEGKTVSYLICEVKDNGIVISLYTGYDPEFRAWSVGTLLWYKAIERLFAEEGLRMMDFTEGEGTHKKFFATASKQCADIYFFRRTFRVRFFLMLHGALDTLSQTAVRTLDRLGWKAYIKKFIRARA